MNDFKKALIDVAGDLSDSERHVKQVLQGKHKRPPKRNLFVLPVFIMAICLIGFTLWLLPNKVERSTNSLKNDALFSYYLATQQLFSGVTEYKEDRQWPINAAFSNYQTTIALQLYAKAQGMTYTEEEYKMQDKLMNALYPEAENPFYEEMTKLSGLSLERYQKFVKPILLETAIYRSQLNERWLSENPKLLEDFAGIYTSNVVNAYVENHFEQELAQAKEHFDVTNNPNSNTTTPKSGTVAAIEGNMIYFIQNVTYAEVQQMSSEQLNRLNEDRLQAWLITDDTSAIQVGDFVRVSVGGTNTSYDRQITNGIAENLEVHIPVNELALPKIMVRNETEWQALTDDVSWQAQHAVNHYLTPRYIVQLEHKTYTVFENDYNKFFLVPYGEATLGGLTQGQTKALESWLQTFVAK